MSICKRNRLSTSTFDPYLLRSQTLKTDRGPRRPATTAGSRCWTGVHFVRCHLELEGWGVGGRQRRCIVPYGVAVAAAAARMGSIVLRLCRTSTPPANPPVGGCMPVNYCTFGERRRRRKKNRGRGEEGGGQRKGDEEHRKRRKEKRRRRSKRHVERE